MIQFLKEQKLVTLPDYLGKFEIRQLPEAFKPTSPGGFMNPPGVYDKDPTGFYFIPTYNPKSKNFYIRAAIEDPRPILGHEGIPGHFMQLSIANHVKDEIRRQHGDNLFIEGWALYGEEMLMRTGLYPVDSASQGQVLRLARYRSARIGVDVNLHTGKWTFEQAVQVFHGSGRARSRSGGRRSGRRGFQPDAEDQLHHREMADHGIVRPLPRQEGERFPARPIPRRADQERQPAALGRRWILLDDPSAVEKAL